MNSRFRTMILLTTATAFIAAGAMAAEGDLHISASVAIKAATSKVQPVYPLIAKQLRLEGDVEVEAHISEDGSVDSVKPLTCNAVLMNAAVFAMLKWKFAPFTEGGKPVKAVAPVQFNFKM